MYLPAATHSAPNGNTSGYDLTATHEYIVAVCHNAGRGHVLLLGQSTPASPRPQPMPSPGISTRARALETRQALPPSLPRPLAPVLGAPRRRRLLAPAFLGHSVSRVAAAKRRRCAQARHKSISMANQAQSDDSRGRRGEETREGKHPKHRGSRGKEGRKEGI